MSATPGPEKWVMLPCRCHAERAGDGWVVAATAFLCTEGHRQGDAVEPPPYTIVGFQHPDQDIC